MRLQGWEARLASVLAGARARPYELGSWDCFRLACQVVEALRGDDLWPQFSGYRTRREALEYIGRYGRSFEACFDRVLAAERVDVKLARRGDIVCVRDASGEKHLGICDGVASLFLAEQGLTKVRTKTCVCSWRVG